VNATSSPFAEVGLTGHTGSKTAGDVMHDTALIHTPGANLACTPDTVRPCLGIAALTVIGLAVVTMPLTWILVVAIAMASAWTLGMSLAYLDRRGHHEIDPESVLSQEIREAYRAILSAFAELDRAVAEAPQLRASVAPSLERCRTAVAFSGQMAQHASWLQLYLDRHDPVHLRAELERTRVPRGDATGVALSHTAAARARQLARYNEIAEQRDLIRARLELVRAAIESFTATVVKLCGEDRKRHLLGGSPVVAQLDEVCR
jgi:hypothetical protein